MQKANLKGENNIFAIRLKGLMENKVTQQQLADVLNIKRQTISLYLNGVSLPPIEKLVDIANYFNVSTDYLLGLAKSPTIEPDIQMIEKYTGLSENAINVLNENELKIKSLNKKYEELYVLFKQKMDLIKEQKKELPKTDYEFLFAKEFENFCKSFGDPYDIERELSEHKDVIKFLERLITSKSLEAFSQYTNDAIFYQAKELKIERYNDYLKNGYCKLSNELEEFKKAAKYIDVDMESEDNETDLSIYRGIKKYMRLIVDISNSIAENGELDGSFFCDEIEEDENADD